MDVKIDDTIYSVYPISIEKAHFLNLYAKATETKAETIEEAQSKAENIKKISDIIFADAVSPKPQPQHTIKLFRIVCNLTDNAVDEADCFRIPKEPSGSSGKTDSGKDGKTTQ